MPGQIAGKRKGSLRCGTADRPQPINSHSSKTWLWIASFLLLISAQQASAQSANNSSAMMTNLSGVSQYTVEFPFMDFFKGQMNNNDANANRLQRVWTTYIPNVTGDTGEEASLKLDANGWPLSVPQAGSKFTALLTHFATGTSAPWYYPAGQYVVLYDGTGTLTYEFDAALVSRSAGRDVINVSSPSQNGIVLSITSSDPKHTGDYIRNIRVTQLKNEAALKAGEIFNPDWLAKVSAFRGYRFMDWTVTNNNTMKNWSDRPQVSEPVWGTPSGVPLEVIISLLNKTGGDGWINIPDQATDDYITQEAKLFHSTLNSKSTIYLEYSNEVWNTIFAQANRARANGLALWPSEDAGVAGYNWYAMRFTQMCSIWKNVWGADAGRVKCTLSTWAAATDGGVIPGPGNDSAAYWNSGYNNLNCPLAVKGGQVSKACYKFADAVAIAPYIGYAVPAAWGADSDGGLTKLFAEINTGGQLPSTTSGAPTTSGTATAFTVRSGQNLTCTPANGTSFVVNLHTGVGTNSTMAVDGCPAYPLTNEAGTPVDHNYGAWPVTLTFTNKVCGSWGATGCAATKSITPTWFISAISAAGYPGGMIAQQTHLITGWAKSLANYGLPLLAYEGGDGLLPAASMQQLMSGLYTAATRDLRMYNVDLTLMTQWKAAGGQIFAQFSDVSQYNQFGNWGMLESIYQTSNTNKYQAFLDFIKLNPCWWANCQQGGLTAPATSTPSSPSSSTGSSDTSSTSPTAPASGTSGSSTTTSSAGYVEYPLKAWFVLPKDGATVKANSTVMIGVAAVDTLANVTSVVIQSDGKTLSSCNNTISCAAFWSLNGITSGSHLITTVAKDSKGNQSTASITVQVQ